MDDNISAADLGDLLGVTPKTVRLWARTGVVVRTRRRGQFALRPSIKGFAAYMRKLADAKGGEKASTAVASERAALLSVQRQRAQLALERERGDLVSLEEVGEEISADYRSVTRDCCLIKSYLLNAIPGIDRMLVETIDEKIREALARIADGGPDRYVERKEKQHA